MSTICSLVAPECRPGERNRNRRIILGVEAAAAKTFRGPVARLENKSPAQGRPRLKVRDSRTLLFCPRVMLQFPCSRGSVRCSGPVYQYQGPGGGAFRNGLLYTIVSVPTEPSARICGRTITCSISSRSPTGGV